MKWEIFFSLKNSKGQAQNSRSISSINGIRSSLPACNDAVKS